MLLDEGSGANFHETNEWWIYSGELRRPLATSLRGACSCGWRGDTSYPLSWEDVDRNAPHLYDTRQLKDEWARHIDDVEARAVPVPDTCSSRSWTRHCPADHGRSHKRTAAAVTVPWKT